ncbi:hypothetical protein P6166_02495 [Stenotrophomonas sp. HITSZ_GD]|uniref:hypothetical protein n=1 Tax=Stenotrophomonas sp. HITSZ_GD TaxID=3037248 RepID=UPI00240D967F|nr:hypothetical protein [Stenotrophomonas sp. HITSZ_GD]MDG2524227.1 hypothetical protein [Stenotrophomonas sp. HITSZ_GD]
MSGSVLSALTAFHTLLSIVAMLVGVVVIAQLLRREAMGRAFWWFWWTAMATSLTGFLFPFHGFTPALGVGVLATLILLVLLQAAGKTGSSRAWARVHAICTVASVYLLVFVAVAQAFAKIPPLHVLAPTGKEPAFALAQGIVLLVFVVLGVASARQRKAAAATIAHS